MVLQESDMFMDALTASTKNKEPRKRKRRTSLSKDGPPEGKKLESCNSDNNLDISPSVTSPSIVTHKNEDKALLKPTFKVLLKLINLFHLIHFFCVFIEITNFT